MKRGDENVRTLCDPCDREQQESTCKLVLHPCGHDCDCVSCTLERLFARKR